MKPIKLFGFAFMGIWLVGLALQSCPANEDSKYLDAVKEFADNVLKYGRDTYGPKHSPLFVDGLNIHTYEPVKGENDTTDNAVTRTIEVKPQAAHDIAITGISMPYDCNQGDIVPITVSLANQSTRGETFRVTLTEETSGKEIASQEVTLAKGWKAEQENIGDVVFDPITSSERFGVVWMEGDINGDHYDDLLIGAPGWNEGTGRIYLYLGGKECNPSSPDAFFEGENPGDAFGAYTCKYTYDINNDGYDDLIVGAPNYSNVDGRVYIYYGGLHIDTTADVIIDGESGSGGRFGMSVGAGDIDGDGYADIIVGAQMYDHGRGRVYLFWGGEKMDTIADLILEGEGYPNGNFKIDYDPPLEVQGWFGRVIDAAGDINADGYDDILVGARHASETYRGAAYLFLGNKKEDMDGVCDYTFRGEAPNDEMGSSVALFDIDNDGFDDVLVGARCANDRGRVYLYWGRKEFTGGHADVILEGEYQSAMGGDDIACGYFNGDPYGDILAAAYNYPASSRREGRAYIFYGNSKSRMDTEFDYVFDGEGNKFDYFGLLVSCGDVNNDGHDDVLTQAGGYKSNQGRAYLYYGPFDAEADITLNWDTTNASIDKHTLKVEISTIPGEKDTADNTMTAKVDVKAPSKQGRKPHRNH